MASAFDQIDDFLELCTHIAAQENFTYVMDNAAYVCFFRFRITHTLGNDFGDDTDTEGMLQKVLTSKTPSFPSNVLMMEQVRAISPYPAKAAR